MTTTKSSTSKQTKAPPFVVHSTHYVSLEPYGTESPTDLPGGSGLPTPDNENAQDYVTDWFVKNPDTTNTSVQGAGVYVLFHSAYATTLSIQTVRFGDEWFHRVEYGDESGAITVRYIKMPEGTYQSMSIGTWPWGYFVWCSHSVQAV